MFTVCVGRSSGGFRVQLETAKSNHRHMILTTPPSTTTTSQLCIHSTELNTARYSFSQWELRHGGRRDKGQEGQEGTECIRSPWFFLFFWALLFVLCCLWCCFSCSAQKPSGLKGLIGKQRKRKEGKVEKRDRSPDEEKTVNGIQKNTNTVTKCPWWSLIYLINYRHYETHSSITVHYLFLTQAFAAQVKVRMVQF